MVLESFCRATPWLAVRGNGTPRSFSLGLQLLEAVVLLRPQCVDTYKIVFNHTSTCAVPPRSTIIREGLGNIWQRSAVLIVQQVFPFLMDKIQSADRVVCTVGFPFERF